MKQNITLLITLFFSIVATAQCDELFISEYVHGGFSNRALEIYNPTPNPVDLSEYSIGRFSNGDGNASDFHGVRLWDTAGELMLASQETYVAVIDKRNTDIYCLDQYVFDGFFEVEERVDSLGEVILDANGNTILQIVFGDVECPDQTTSLGPIKGDTYYAQFDLMGKADGFYTPEYGLNQAMYWNGNDAVALVKGTTITNDFSNVIDVVGIIGDDPGTETGWTNGDGQAMTASSTIIRAAPVEGGSVQLAGDTFNYEDWWWKPKYTFSYLGSHDCACAWSTGISNIIGQSDVKMFPNPTSGEMLNIQADEAIESVSMQTLDGKVVELFQFNAQEKQVRLELNQFSAGLYFAKINLVNGNQVAGKVIVK